MYSQVWLHLGFRKISLKSSRGKSLEVGDGIEE